MTPSFSRSTRAALALVSVVATLALLGTTQRFDHAHHHTQRLLTAWPSSRALRVEVHTNDASFTASGIVFPRSDRLQSLAFDGLLTYDVNGIEHKYTVVNGRGFVTMENATTRETMHSGCLSPSDAPPFHLLAASLQSARVIDDAPVHGHSQEACGLQNPLVEIQFAGDSYVFCSHSDGRVDTVYGEHFRVVFSPFHLGKVTKEELLHLPSGHSTASCELLTGHDKVSEPTIPLEAPLRSLRDVATRTQDAARVVLRQPRQAPIDSCGTACKDGKKRCLFVHGLGQNPNHELVTDEFTDMWGDAATNLPCCSETKFLRMNTVDNAWYSEILMNQCCGAAISLSDSSDPMALDGLAVLAHSMGNLVVANAAMNNRCAIGATSKWIAMGGPMRGSYSANLGVDVCGRNETIADTAVVKTLSLVNICPANNTTRSLVFQESDLTTDALNELYAKAEATYAQYVTASMCGTSPVGLGTQFSAVYSTLDTLAAHQSPSDGAVEINSCRGPFPESAYSTSWRGGRFYRAALNHADVTMLNGDGLWGDDRQPIKWVNCQF